MPRSARLRSSTGVYHVMARGINRQNIFNDDEDRHKYVATLQRYKEICGYNVYAYCLMSNHIHILLKEGIETIGQIMKRIGTSYAYWYNYKYERNGYLFQGRYKSECVENDKHFMAVLRYIHQNPLMAGLVAELSDYKWSSYNEYINQECIVTDISFALNYFDPDPKTGVKYFKEFMKQENQNKCLDDEVKSMKMLRDSEVQRLYYDITGLDNIQALQSMPKMDRDEVIRRLRKQSASIRQLSRLTGLSRSIIAGANKR